MNPLNAILNQFKSLSLDQINEFNFMERFDIKYIIHQNELNNYLKELISDYTILEVNNKRIRKYETLYFDTPALNFYYAHHRGKLNRIKVRYRKYLDSNDLFLK